MTDANKIVQHVKAAESAMVESARSGFLDDSDLEDLRVLIRLVVEFYYDVRGEGLYRLRDFDPDWLKKGEGEHYEALRASWAARASREELRYHSDSTFSGIDSFRSITQAYELLVGAEESKMTWEAQSGDKLIATYILMFGEFSSQSQFMRQCRLLLDLFKMQIVFAGQVY
jgi:hypothetical protein